MGEHLAAWMGNVATRLFGPVFALDAVRIGRRMSTFILRGIYLLMLAFVLSYFFLIALVDQRLQSSMLQPNAIRQIAENFFWTYSITQFLIVTALTPALTAGAITDEKERKTLDFLLITDLSGREIVFGKMAARMGVLVTFVIAGLPIIALMQLLGGIEPRLLFLSCGMTLATVASLAGVGMAASALMKRTREAVVLAYVAPLAYLIVLPMIAPTAGSGGVWSSVIEALSAGHPFMSFSRISLSLGDGIPTEAIQYMLFHFVVAFLGFALAAFVLRRSVTKARGPRGMRRSQLGGNRKHPPVSDTPIRWREIHVEPGNLPGILRRLFALGLLAIVFLPFISIVIEFLLSANHFLSDPIKAFQIATKIWVCAVTCGLGILLLLAATVRGASSVAGERDRDTWTTLMTTPLSLDEILWGKYFGCIWGQKGLMYLLGIVWAIGLLTGSVSFLVVVPMIATLGAYLHAFSWLGIRCSITARTSRIGIARAVPLALLFGGGFWWILGCCLGGMAGITQGKGAEFFGYLGAAIAGMTPPFVLAALPAVESEMLLDAIRDSKGLALAGSFIFGLVGGGVCWVMLGNHWAKESCARLADECNRNPRARPRIRKPKPFTLPPAPPESLDSAAAT